MTDPTNDYATPHWLLHNHPATVEPWTRDWTDAAERSLAWWLRANSVDDAVGAPDWAIARALIAQLRAMHTAAEPVAVTLPDPKPAPR